MKKLIIILIFIPFLSFGQQFTAVKEIANKTSEQLYNTAREWFSLTFNSAKDVIQLEDHIQKKIIGKGVHQVNWPVRGIIVEAHLFYTINTQFKDGRYKYDIQSSEIKTLDGSSFTYSELKEMCTEEGLKSYYKRKGIGWSLGKNKIREGVENNKQLVSQCDESLQSIVDNLTLALKKQDKSENW